ncbi:YdeI/OmpD-associated family protein [Carboxylicivirga linearis]|uniref:YdeI/OmpD-associated family protein n=1 Tax=Carboxylicivirga linearis TaxID=1628157 RepID=A0ABS5K1H9_9BACT|nr:YdeI/OmpD-associated family protein [Carboxylicivirga linearis]MBS2101013.1 YdeI/OmpD-associated family protein [Carboxylicivirga linearis]
MNGLNPKVDQYLMEGCMRCPKGGTPDCKVHTWHKELNQLRAIVLSCGLTEDYKWSMPCYTSQKKNILMVIAFKHHCCISFFKGSLLSNSHQLLISPGENSQAIRQFRFTNIAQILKIEDIIRATIFEAIEVEKAGLKINYQPLEISIPEEFQLKLNEFPPLKIAFEALTPGRQKAYLWYFSKAKQSKTRKARVEKYIPKILKGKGIND